MQTIVISLGGSVIIPKEINIKFLKEFKNLVLRHSRNKKFIITCGGGITARKYIKAYRTIVGKQDGGSYDVGIMATRLNAELIRILFSGHAYKEVVYSPKKIKFKKILTTAGNKPGSSSDADAVMLARNYGVKEIINLTDVSYVYDKDPKKYKKVRPLKQLSWNQYLKVIGTKWKAGMEYPFDPLASKIAKRFRKKVIVMKGIKNLRNYLSNKKYKGTVIE